MRVATVPPMMSKNAMTWASEAAPTQHLHHALKRPRRLSWVAAGIALLGLSGCATRPDRDANDLAIHLTFLEDQRTTKEEAILQLGQPSGQYEGDRILTWRLADDRERILRVVEREGAGGWEIARYSLVLVFDEHHVLTLHNLLRVR